MHPFLDGVGCVLLLGVFVLIFGKAGIIFLIVMFVLTVALVAVIKDETKNTKTKPQKRDIDEEYNNWLASEIIREDWEKKHDKR